MKNSENVETPLPQGETAVKKPYSAPAISDFLDTVTVFGTDDPENRGRRRPVPSP